MIDREELRRLSAAYKVASARYGRALKEQRSERETGPVDSNRASGLVQEARAEFDLIRTKMGAELQATKPQAPRSGKPPKVSSRTYRSDGNRRSSLV